MAQPVRLEDLTVDEECGGTFLEEVARMGFRIRKMHYTTNEFGDSGREWEAQLITLRVNCCAGRPFIQTIRT